MYSDLYDHECTLCPLHADVQSVCIEGTGNPVSSHAMVIGEAPGRDEDAAGRPFVGRAGALLDEALVTAFISPHARREVFVTNVVKCRPPGNRTPTQREQQACLTYLQDEIERVDPYVILALGSAALWVLLRETGIVSKRGGWYRLDRERETWVMPTYHPAFVGYQGGVGSPTWEQFVGDVEMFANRAIARMGEP